MTPDQKTIDRVCVGLADLALQEHSSRTSHIRVADEVVCLGIPASFGFLCLLLGIPEPIPDWAERALEGHHGRPEQLVEKLRELAGGKSPEPLTTGEMTHPISICKQCEERIHWTGKYWEHTDSTPRHPGQPKGETE